MKRKLLSSSVLLLAACLFNAAHAAEGPATQAAARALWSKAAPAVYSYVVEHSSTAIAACRDSTGESLPLNPAKILVRAGTIRITTLLDQDILAPCSNLVYTIDRIFEVIEGEQAGPAGTRGMCIQVAYNAEFGFPESVENVCELDGDTPIRVRDFRVLGADAPLVVMRMESRTASIPAAAHLNYNMTFTEIERTETTSLVEILYEPKRGSPGLNAIEGRIACRDLLLSRRQWHSEPSLEHWSCR